MIGVAIRALPAIAAIGLAGVVSTATIRAGVSGAGDQDNDDSRYRGISGNGRFVAFEAAATNLVSDEFNAARDVFVFDGVTKKTTLVSRSSTGVQGDAGSIYPAIAASGLFVAFMSSATTLVADDTNGTTDIFVGGPLW